MILGMQIITDKKFQTIFSGPGSTIDTALPYMNEIKSENIKHVTSYVWEGNLLGYIIFYEDDNIYACPGCGHHISNTFSYCPNCAHKMDPSVDAPLKCPTCNNDVAYTFDYCPHCATKLR